MQMTQGSGVSIKKKKKVKIIKKQNVNFVRTGYFVLFTTVSLAPRTRPAT